MRYAIYVLQSNDTYRDLEDVFEAEGPRQAAQRVFDRLDIGDLHPDEEFPQVIVVPDDHVHVFTRNDEGRAVTMSEDIRRLTTKGPCYATVTFNPEALCDEP